MELTEVSQPSLDSALQRVKILEPQGFHLQVLIFNIFPVSKDGFWDNHVMLV